MVSNRGRLTRLEASIRVLQLNGSPLTPREMVDIGTLNGLFPGHERDLAPSVNFALNKESRRADGRVMQLADGRYALVEWGYQRGPDQKRGPRVGKARTEADTAVERVKEIRRFRKGLIGMSPSRICLFIEFCYQMKLYEDALGLFQKLPHDQVDPEWLKRVGMLERVCRQRLGI